MKKIATLFSLFTLLSGVLLAEIVESNRMKDLYQYLTPETLVIFDIDNTLIAPVQDLGTDQWFKSRTKLYEEKGWEQQPALEKALSEWMAVQNITEVGLIEEDIASIIQHLQEEGFTVMGLTTRGLGMSTRTNEQLASVNIHLDKTAPTKEEIFFKNDRGVLFRGGTLFTANTHKGKALFRFLDRLDFLPKAIMFINDKHSHILPVAEYARNWGIPFIGIRYGAADERVKSLDTDLTDIQFEFFGRILSDDEAKVIQNKIPHFVPEK